MTSTPWATYGTPSEVFDALQEAMRFEMTVDSHAEFVSLCLETYMTALLWGDSDYDPIEDSIQDALAQGWIERAGDRYPPTPKGRARLALLRAWAMKRERDEV